MFICVNHLRSLIINNTILIIGKFKRFIEIYYALFLSKFPGMKRIGIIGLDENIAAHIEKIQSINGFDLVGLYDHNSTAARETAQKYDLLSFSHPFELIEQTDILDFATPHPMDTEHAYMAIRSARHLFLESRFLQDAQQAQRLMNLADEARVKVQVSSCDRFNPVVQKAKEYIQQPSIIETRRAITHQQSRKMLNPVLDLLFDDIDLITHFMDSGVRKIQTRTNNPFSSQVDLINVRIEFDNACVANLNVSSLSNVSYAKAAFYQENAVIHLDLLESKLEVLSSSSGKNTSKALSFDSNSSGATSLVSELQSFNHCIEKNTHPVVGLNEAAQSLEILDEIKSQLVSNIA